MFCLKISETGIGIFLLLINFHEIVWFVSVVEFGFVRFPLFWFGIQYHKELRV